jgi:hypothetical protein
MTPAEPEPHAPQNVGRARLTRGQPSTQPPYAQLSPKREDLTRSDLGFYSSSLFLCVRFVPMLAPCSLVSYDRGRGVLVKTGPIRRIPGPTARSVLAHH